MYFMPKTLVIALDMNIHEDNYLDFGDLKADKKIKIIQERIDTICQKLQKSNPEDKWIFAWRDDGVSEMESDYVSTATKEHLKKAMLELTNKYPNLGIIAGTTPTRKKTTMQKAQEILPYYSESKWIEASERKQPSVKGLLKHKQEVIRAIEKNKPNQPLDVLRNTSYIFERGKIQRHDKMAPFFESEGTNQEGHPEIFKPGGKKGRNINHFLEVQKCKVALEICREHGHGFAKKEGIEEKKEIPLLHFVLGDSIPLHFAAEPISEEYQSKENHLFGTNIIHLDSKNAPVIIQTQDSKETVELWVNNILDNNATITKIEPIYPFRILALNQIDNLLAHSEKSSDEYKIIAELKQTILKKYNRNLELTDKSCQYFYNAIMVAVDKYKKILPAEEKSSKFLDCTSSLLKTLQENYKKIQQLKPLKARIIEKIDAYIHSRTQPGLAHKLFGDSKLTIEKIKLMREFKQKINNTNDLRLMKSYCKEYKAWNAEHEDKHNKKYFIIGSDFDNCINQIEKTIQSTNEPSTKHLLK